MAPADRARPACLYYDRPATDWEREALPIGNGRIGAMVFGGIESERLQLNVDSLWSGRSVSDEAYDTREFGYYETLGNLYLELDGKLTPSDYARKLDLERSVCSSSFELGDATRVLRRAFASNPAEVIAVQLTAHGTSRLSGKIRLEGCHGETPHADANQRAPSIGFSGSLDNGLRYAAKLRLVADSDCRLTAGDGWLRFESAQELLLYFSADTDYVPDSAARYRGSAPEPRVEAWLDAALTRGFEALLAEHQADYCALFDRARVTLGQSAPELWALPLEQRLARYSAGQDPELEALLFDYGRYLLISSSRDNGLPANLQGLWNQSNEPPWHCDYHSNINLQMCYWPAEPANLAECHRPLFKLLDATLPECRAATRAAFGANVPGFTYRTSHNCFGGQGWKWNGPASAWYATHYYEHYAFSGDREFLEHRAWPYLKEVCEFWLHRLTRSSDGSLVSPLGWSPEHGPEEAGIAHDQQLVWELFSDAIAAGIALGGQEPLLERLRTARADLATPRVGRFGQLQEWREDRDDPRDRHRHTSHLVGLFPGRSIDPKLTPAWAAAAEVSLRARGDSDDARRSWTWPWRALLWARLRKPDGHRMIDGLILHNLLPNLLANHPPLQLDGNYGITAAICEMLLQSQQGELRLLPGVDLRRWRDGAFHGFRARGGIEVSARWRRGRLEQAELSTRLGGPLRLCAPDAVTGVVRGSETLGVAPEADGSVLLSTEPGQVYSVRF